MALQIGDKVSFLNEAGSGEILSFLPGARARVLTDHGLEVDYPVKYLVFLSSRSDYSLQPSSEEKFIRAKIQSEKKARKKAIPARERILEIDLHIYELVDDQRGLMNSDMLRIQMQAFKRKMKEAMDKRVQKLIIIHGVGEGVLRSEIRHALRQYEKIEVNDADYEKYGRGATEVRFIGH